MAELLEARLIDVEVENTDLRRSVEKQAVEIEDMRGQLCHCSKTSLVTATSNVEVQEEGGLEYAEEEPSNRTEYHTPPSGALDWDRLIAGDRLEVFGGGVLEDVKEEARVQLEDLSGWGHESASPNLRSCACRREHLCNRPPAVQYLDDVMTFEESGVVLHHVGDREESYPVRGGEDTSPSTSPVSTPPSLENEDPIPVVVRSSSESIGSPAMSAVVRRGQRAIRMRGVPKSLFHPYPDSSRRGVGYRRKGESDGDESSDGESSRKAARRRPLVEISLDGGSCCDRRRRQGDRGSS